MKLSWPERQAGLVSNMLKVACSRYDDHQTGNLPDTLTRDTRSLHPLRTRKGGGSHVFRTSSQIPHFAILSKTCHRCSSHRQLAEAEIEMGQGALPVTH